MEQRQITGVVWHEYGRRVTVFYVDGEPDQLVGSAAMAAALAAEAGLRLVETPPWHRSLGARPGAPARPGARLEPAAKARGRCATGAPDPLTTLPAGMVGVTGSARPSPPWQVGAEGADDGRPTTPARHLTDA